MEDLQGIGLETRMQFDRLVTEGLDPKTVAIYRGYGEALDAVEIHAYTDCELIRKETTPQYLGAKVQKRLSDAVAVVLDHESKLAELEQGQLADLRRRIPQEPKLSEVEANTELQRDVYILNQLGSDVLNDPLQLRIAYLDAVEQGNAAIVGALERDLMGRAKRILKDADWEAGRAVKGLAADPTLAGAIEAIEMVCTTYRSRIRTALTRLQRAGWAPPDPIAEMAGAPKPPEAA